MSPRAPNHLAALAAALLACGLLPPPARAQDQHQDRPPAPSEDPNPTTTVVEAPPAPAILSAATDLRQLDYPTVTLDRQNLAKIALASPEEIAPDLRITHRGVGLLEERQDGTLEFVPTTTVPRVAGERFGWVIRFDTSRDDIALTEVFRLPQPITITGDARQTTVSDGGKTATTPRPVSGLWDWAQNFWAFDPTDPTGPHSFEVLLGDTTLLKAEFVVTR